MLLTCHGVECIHKFVLCQRLVGCVDLVGNQCNMHRQFVRNRDTFIWTVLFEIVGFIGCLAVPVA